MANVLSNLISKPAEDGNAMAIIISTVNSDEFLNTRIITQLMKPFSLCLR